MMLHNFYKITKSVTKFWMHIKRADISHRCQPDTNQLNAVPSQTRLILNAKYSYDAFHSFLLVFCLEGRGGDIAATTGTKTAGEA